MNIWWDQLSIRERIIVMAAALIGLLIAADTLVLEPYRMKVDIMDKSLLQAKDDLEWMNQAVLRLPDAGKNQNGVNSGKVVTFVDRQISRLKLKSHMQQMTPIGNHSVRLRMSDIEFSKLLRFFNSIDSSLITEEVRITSADNIGFVNVSVVVSNGQNGS